MSALPGYGVMGFPMPQGTMPSGGLLGKLGGLLGTGQTYGGLLSPDDQKAARQQALLAMGAQLLQAGGPSPTKTSLGQALGQSLIAGSQAGQQASQNALQAALLKSQVERNTKADKGNLVAVIDPATGKPKYVPADQAPGMQPYATPVNQAKDAASIQEYNLYSQQTSAAGGTPEPFDKWLARRSALTVGAPYQLGEMGGERGAFSRVTGWFTPQTTLPQEATAASTMAGATAAGKVTGEKTAEAEIDLPRVEQNVSESLDVLKKLREHPGLPYITGLYSKAPIVPGTPQAAADALAQQVQGQTFLQAYQTLKGGGQITEVEGKKAEGAIARLQRTQKTEDYQKALDDLSDVLSTGLERMRKTAGKKQPKRSREEILKQYGL